MKGTGQYVHKSQHRLLMEQKLGRELREDEVVHHVNGIKNDNRLENLQVMTKKQHAMVHAADRRGPRLETTNLDRFQFRVPPDLYGEVRSRAQANHRDFNRELIYLIELGLKTDPERRSA